MRNAVGGRLQSIENTTGRTAAIFLSARQARRSIRISTDPFSAGLNAERESLRENKWLEMKSKANFAEGKKGG